MNSRNYDDNYNQNGKGDYPQDYPGENPKDYPGEYTQDYPVENPKDYPEEYTGDFNEYGDGEEGSVSGQSNYQEPIFGEFNCVDCFAVFTGILQFVLGLVSMAIGGVITGEVGFGDIGYLGFDNLFTRRYNFGVPMFTGLFVSILKSLFSMLLLLIVTQSRFHL